MLVLLTDLLSTSWGSLLSILSQQDQGGGGTNKSWDEANIPSLYNLYNTQLNILKEQSQVKKRTDLKHRLVFLKEGFQDILKKDVSVIF